MASFTQAQLDSLRRAYAAGVTRVSYGDKSTEYRSLEEMRRLITEIETDLGLRARSRRLYIRARGDKAL